MVLFLIFFCKSFSLTIYNSVKTRTNASWYICVNLQSVHWRMSSSLWSQRKYSHFFYMKFTRSNAFSERAVVCIISMYTANTRPEHDTIVANGKLFSAIHTRILHVDSKNNINTSVSCVCHDCPNSESRLDAATECGIDTRLHKTAEPSDSVVILFGCGLLQHAYAMHGAHIQFITNWCCWGCCCWTRSRARASITHPSRGRRTICSGKYLHPLCLYLYSMQTSKAFAFFV